MKRTLYVYIIKNAISISVQAPSCFNLNTHIERIDSIQTNRTIRSFNLKADCTSTCIQEHQPIDYCTLRRTKDIFYFILSPSMYKILKTWLLTEKLCFWYMHHYCETSLINQTLQLTIMFVYFMKRGKATRDNYQFILHT